MDWIFFKNVNWDDTNYNMYSVDTRDFHVACILDSNIEKNYKHLITKLRNTIYKRLRKILDIKPCINKRELQQSLSSDINNELMDKYLFSASEIKSLLNKWFEESGGDVKWRMLLFDNYEETTGWDWKYIKIYRTPFGFFIGPGTNAKHGSIEPKQNILKFEIKQRYLHAH